MAKKQKYYVVWAGVNPGIYDSWTDCQLQTKGYEGAQFKAFDTRQEAEQAFASPPHAYIGKRAAHTAKATRQAATLPLPEAVRTNCLAVDAACSGNPGQMEYRGVHLPSGQQVFHYGPVYGTNNIGEFLAIVHALALLKQKGQDMPEEVQDQAAPQRPQRSPLPTDRARREVAAREYLRHPPAEMGNGTMGGNPCGLRPETLMAPLLSP